MKVDFRKIIVKDVQGKPIACELEKEIGNLFYNTTSSLEDLEIAQRIYNSTGEVELAVDEWCKVKNCVMSQTTARVKAGFIEYEKTLKLE